MVKSPSPRPVDLSVIVVSHNEGELLERTVRSLIATLPEQGTEVIIVDDQSDDDSTVFLKRLDRSSVRLIRSPERLGISAARNLGARSSCGEVIVFSDAHVHVYPGWAEPLWLTALKPFVGAVAPVVHSMHEPHIKGYGFTWRDPSLKMHWLRRRGTAPYPVPFLCGCFVALSRTLFEMTGGFDEGLIRWGSEDAELSLRLWRMGYECHVVPRSSVAHLFRKKFPYQVSWEGILHNTLRLATVHFGPRALSRVMQHWNDHAALPRATATLCLSDVWSRREKVQRTCRYPDTRVLDRFRIEALS